ncbi:MAG: BCCT family transporter, partial [Gammaproteobacteria bacterium]|nr:BCCT family transporter [Gammaproteobacteria bacterium]
MKITPKYKHLVYILSPLFFIIGFLITLKAPRIFIDFNYWHWLALFGAILLAFGPWGKKHLSLKDDTKPRYSPASWIIRIIIFEACLGLMYLAIGVLFNNVAHGQHIALPHFWQTNLQGFSLHYGLFPWALYAVVAVGIGYFALIKGEDTFFSNFINQFINAAHQSKLASTVNVLARQAQNMTISVTIGAAILMLFFILPASFVHSFDFKSSAAALTLMLLLLFSMTRPFKNYLRKSQQRGRPIWLLLLFLAIFFILGFSVLTHGFSTITTDNNQINNFQWLENMPWLISWKLFSLCWWLGWTPIMASALLRISRGYNIRIIILAILMPVLCFHFIALGLPHINFNDPIIQKIMLGIGGIA